MDLDEHYDNTDDMYCEIADRLEAVEAAAPAASTIGAIPTHVGPKGKEGKAKGSGGGKVCSALACLTALHVVSPSSASWSARLRGVGNARCVHSLFGL